MIKLSWIGDIIVLSTEPLIIILLLAKQMWTSPAASSMLYLPNKVMSSQPARGKYNRLYNRLI